MSKNTFLKVRVTEDERARYMAALKSQDKTLSEVIRQALDQMADSAEQSAANG